MESDYIAPKLIEWKDSYSVGVNFIDEQHKKLFLYINEFYQAMRDNKDKEILGKVIADLADYVDTHFSTEEKLFEKFNYEGRDEHIALHKQYVDKIKSFQDGYAKNQMFLSFEIIDFLEDWILKHINSEDKKYTKCFNEHGLS